MRATLHRRTLALALAGLWGAATYACTSVEGLTDGAGAPDSSSDRSAPGDDASSDATDAARDTSSALDGGGCDASFCDDFDDGPLGARWTNAYGTRATVTLAADGSVSPPNALRVAVDTPVGQTWGHGGFGLDIGQKSRVRCTVDLFVEHGPDAASPYPVDVLVLQMKAPEAGIDSYELRLAVGATTFSVRDDRRYADGGCDCPRVENKGGTVKFGAWTHLDFSTDLSTYRLLADNALAVTGTLVPTRIDATEIRLALENFWPETWIVRYDNFACDY